MASTERDLIHRLLLTGTPMLLAHFAVVLWHLCLLVRVEPSTPTLMPPLLILFNLVPLAGLLALRKGYKKSAGTMITVPLAIVLVIGFSAHFLSSGADNVFRMAPGEWRLSFQISAVLLVCLEALGCWIGLRAFPLQREKVRANN
jgi:O-antigen ligase